MTAYTTQTLCANVVYGVPNGNYDGSSTSFISNVVPAANYYGGQGAIQTLTVQTNGFVGLITVQATLNDLQDSAPWFDIATFGDPGNATTAMSSNTVVGNFTWVRAAITEYTAGNINYSTASY